ncbi:MAG: tRNA pseudouridine(38-40) synthase TruA [Anaerolineales bacterium]
MARYQIIFAYDGTELSGSQRQANLPTAQSELESALRRLGWQGESILLAGRTDSGVHAAGQVAACDLNWNHTPDELLRALNSQLPPEMAVSLVRQVRPDFHPRFDAISRCYRYSLFCQPQRDPLRERFAWRVWPAPSDELLFSAAPLLVGSHDFAAFGTPPRPAGSTQRNVLQAVWRKTDPVSWQFEVSANAFLYRMVRRMVFLQVSVAQEKLSLENFSSAINRPGSVPVPAGLAPAHGLTLLEVNYPDDLT